MQAWNQVKVVDKDSEHIGRAGLVTGVKGDQVTVKLDADEVNQAVEAVFAETQLVILGGN